MENPESNVPNILTGECHAYQGNASHQLETSYDPNDVSTEANGTDANNKNTAPDYGRAPPIKKPGKQSYASLFKDNRAPVEASLLKFIEPPNGEVVIGCEEIDTVEKTFGYCLVGYVMGQRPSAYNVINFVKRWGSNVKFQFKENGWIMFQFANELQRDSVLKGGPYIISGRQLFLKLMPSCFLFGKEDMVYLPSWVQIYGLPADCWTPPALSRIASVVGKPIHTDQLTISKKGLTYARVLVEIDAKKPRVWECSVKLPTGKLTAVKFKYELEPKYCNVCNSLGHITELCGVDLRRNNNNQQRKAPDSNKNIAPTDNLKCGDNLSNDCGSKQHDIPESSDSKDTHSPVEDDCSQQNQEKHASASTGMKQDNGKGNPSTNHPPEMKNIDQQHATGVKMKDIMGKNATANFSEGGQIPLHDFEEDDLLSNDGMDWHSPREDDFYWDENDTEDILSRVQTQDRDEWKTVTKKNRRIKNKAKIEAHKSNAGCDTSSAGTEYVAIDPTTNQPMRGGQSRMFRKDNSEARRPDTASGNI